MRNCNLVPGVLSLYLSSEEGRTPENEVWENKEQYCFYYFLFINGRHLLPVVWRMGNLTEGKTSLASVEDNSLRRVKTINGDHM